MTSLEQHAEVSASRKFSLGQMVSKKSGSSWTGKVVGFYSTGQTSVGYCVESIREPGSVQIYPEHALAPYTPEPAGDLVERLRKPIDAERIYGWIIQKRKEATSDFPRLGFVNEMELIDEERMEAAAAIATLLNHTATYEDGYTAGELKWAEAMDKQIGIEENLRTQLAASQADVARLREAIKRARKASLKAVNSVYGILEVSIKDTQP